jgi:DNA-binding response OmpR family regulator
MKKIKKVKKRIFSSEEILNLLVKKMGYKPSDDNLFDVTWNIKHLASDNNIEIIFTRKLRKKEIKQ